MVIYLRTSLVNEMNKTPIYHLVPATVSPKNRRENIRDTLMICNKVIFIHWHIVMITFLLNCGLLFRIKKQQLFFTPNMNTDESYFYFHSSFASFSCIRIQSGYIFAFTSLSFRLLFVLMPSMYFVIRNNKDQEFCSHISCWVLIKTVCCYSTVANWKQRLKRS